MEQKANRLWSVVFLLAAVALGLVYYKYHDYFVPKAMIDLPLGVDCDLHAGACETALPTKGKVSFSITPSTIPLLKPLELSVRVEGMKVNAVEVDFAGVDMNMGFNRSKLPRTTDGLYQGEATLPVCIRSRMDWEAKVMLHTDNGLIVAPFRFETIK